MKRFWVIALVLAAATACSNAPLAPSEAGGLRLQGAISSATIAPAQFEDLTFSLQNVSSETAIIEFPQACRILIFIETTSGRVVFPSSGSYACADVVTMLSLEPGGEHAVTLKIFGEQFVQAIHTGVPIPKGRYRAYAKVSANRGTVELRSPYTHFEVR